MSLIHKVQCPIFVLGHLSNVLSALDLGCLACFRKYPAHTLIQLAYYQVWWQTDHLNQVWWSSQAWKHTGRGTQAQCLIRYKMLIAHHSGLEITIADTKGPGSSVAQSLIDLIQIWIAYTWREKSLFFLWIQLKSMWQVSYRTKIKSVKTNFNDQAVLSDVYHSDIVLESSLNSRYILHPCFCVK